MKRMDETVMIGRPCMAVMYGGVQPQLFKEIADGSAADHLSSFRNILSDVRWSVAAFYVENYSSAVKLEGSNE
jgi:hypothetical protein